MYNFQTKSLLNCIKLFRTLCNICTDVPTFTCTPCTNTGFAFKIHARMYTNAHLHANALLHIHATTPHIHMQINESFAHMHARVYTIFINTCLHARMFAHLCSVVFLSVTVNQLLRENNRAIKTHVCPFPFTSVSSRSRGYDDRFWTVNLNYG